ncbi:hypothetical protein HX109_14835 [Galbibacter sp. BG1]|uniref:hypothetical protein n=1 Tax=Galbibacter sp. BG1 TaxID=1170699 RepID=UPI0015B97CCF|nr:hypothetical protein [Galbibacter sp. BG1]QLE02777.1 hypothetical protein HX109_14835 [Galbibacter sp. BG1]
MKRIKSVLPSDIIIVSLLLFASFITYIHVYLPDSQLWETTLFTLRSKDTTTVQYAVYSSCLLFSHLIPYTLWYITSNQWWRYGVLILISNELYKLFIVIYNYIELPFSAPEYLIYVLSVIFLILIIMASRKLKYSFRYRLNEDYMNSEIVLNYKFQNIYHYQNILISLEELIRDAREYPKKQKIIELLQSIDESEFKKNNTWSQNNSLAVFLGIILISAFVATPFIDRIYYIAPETATWQLGWFTIGSYNLPNVKFFFWFFTYFYLTFFINLNLWFLTSRYWWKYFILIPIVLTAYQLISLLSPDVRYIHENEIWQALPILIILTGFLIWISLKIDNYHKVERIKDKIKVETFKIVALLAEKENGNRVAATKQEIELLIKNKDSYEPQEYLNKLELLYAELQKQKHPE